MDNSPQKSNSPDPTNSANYPLQPDPDRRLSDQPKRRMGNASKMRELVRQCDDSDSRSRFLDMCSEVDSVYERRTPDDPTALYMDGLGWTTNVDWGGMEFGVDSAIAPEYNLLTMPETYVRLETVYEGLDLGDQKRTVEMEDKRFLDDWDEWVPELGKMLLQRKKYGLGIFYFRDPRSWEFHSLHPGNLLTNCPNINPKYWPWCAIHTNFDISELLRKFDGDKDPKSDSEGFADDGWNRANIRKALEVHCRHASIDWRVADDKNADFWRDEYLFNDLYWSGKNELQIPGYICYVREFDGSITEYLLTENEEVGFLFRSPEGRGLAQLSDAFCMFPEHCGQARFREVRGYGTKNLPFFDAENMMNNRLLDSAYLGSSLFVRGGTPDDLYSQSEMMIGPITMLPANLEIQASQMPDVGKAMVPIHEHLLRQRQANAPASGGEGYGAGPDRETAKAATFRFQSGQRLQNYSVNFLYRAAERFHRVRVQRYLSDNILSTDPGYEEAKEAISRMAAKGVTPEFIASIDRKATKICRIFGDGDPAKLFADMMELLPIIGAFPEGGKQEFYRVVTHAKAGHDLSNAFLGSKTYDPTMMRNRVNAQLENGHFENANARVDVAGDDNHLVHTGEHVSFLEASVAAAQQSGGDQKKVFEMLSRAMSHIGINEDGQVAGGHVAALLQDPAGAEIGQDFVRRLSELANLRRQLEQQLGAQQQAEQEQQLQDLRQPLEEQSKAAKVQQQMEIEAEKAQIEIARLQESAKYEKTKHDLELQKLRAELATELAKQQTQQTPPSA